MKFLFPEMSYFDMFEVLLREYNMSPEQARGTYFFKCRVTGQTCSMCLGPVSAACSLGEAATSGLTAYDGTLLVELYAVERLRRTMMTAFTSTGKVPGEQDKPKSGRTKNKPRSEQDAKDNTLDPFKGFPNDLVPLTHDQIDKRVEASKTAASAGLLGPHKMWGKRRAEAARGSFGILPRRCSHDDFMWALYCNNQEITVDEVYKRATANWLVTKMSQSSDEELKQKMLQRLEKL